MKFRFYLFQLLFISNCFSQNLVKNPSFEEMNFCPKHFVISNKKKFPAKYWSLPTPATTDLMSNCNTKKKVSTPYNQAGFQEPRTGNNYIRSIYGSLFGEEYIECIQGYLSAPLEKNKKYKVEFWVSLGDNSCYSAKNIGAYLSKTKPKSDKLCSLDVTPQIKCNKYITNCNEWTKISGIYTAKGGEKYITIGNFYKKTLILKEVRNKKIKSYMSNYYIDDVSVTEIIIPTLDTIKKDTNTNELYVEHKTIILKNVNFHVDSYELSDTSFAELNSIASQLIEKPDLIVHLCGHTDNTGNEEYNLKLSEQRVMSIKSYLIDKGIYEKQIVCKGFGNSSPIESNETEEGRQANRRVEFYFSSEE